MQRGTSSGCCALIPALAARRNAASPGGEGADRDTNGGFVRLLTLWHVCLPTAARPGAAQRGNTVLVRGRFGTSCGLRLQSQEYAARVRSGRNGARPEPFALAG